MRDSLVRWIRAADAARHFDYFQTVQEQPELLRVRTRADEYYISLVGELFDSMRRERTHPEDWSRLGNAFADFAATDGARTAASVHVSQMEASLYAAAAFYYGGFPASAYLIARSQETDSLDRSSPTTACFDFLARPPVMTSELGNRVREGLRVGAMSELEAIGREVETQAAEALRIGPDAWIPARLAQKLMESFLRTNLRFVLPDGGTDFWTPLVSSLITRSSWEFFPSQVSAIRRGLLDSSETFSLQMPTGAGKTALCETLLYRHAKVTTGTVAVLLVPYRSLASELRGSVIKRLNAMGISSRCAYGGTVPTGEEVQNLDETRVMVATPEAISAILSAAPAFFHRISVVICDEGHLLDSEGRGVSLELLLARMRARDSGAPRFVFVSAIVPNIEEINSWLGGGPESVIRSEYRPATAEFAVLRARNEDTTLPIVLEMHPHEDERNRFSIPEFLTRQDFRWWNATTRRRNTHNFSSVKARAIATARKALPMGAVAVFAANKRGAQGAIGLVKELISQVQHGLPLPNPEDYASSRHIGSATDYLQREYGADWVGTRAIGMGTVLHHGDIPQETREILESLIRDGHAHLAVCTSTLAEGVNLPIRTLVLYSIKRGGSDNRTRPLLIRDIQNLVGRAGRAGATTKGLVICANEDQWPIVKLVAKQTPGEAVTGALRTLMGRLVKALALRKLTLSNEVLEASPVVHLLVDGVDAALIDLASEELGKEELIQLAIRVADDTFASRQETDEPSRSLLRKVFECRARRIGELAESGRLGWIRETGTRVRLLKRVEMSLLPQRSRWDDVGDPIEDGFVGTMLEWAWRQPELRRAVRKAYRLADEVGTESVSGQFFDVVHMWLEGRRFVVIAKAARVSIDDLLGVYTGAVGFVLQTLVEQAIALLERLVESEGSGVSEAVRVFPEHLRFGVPTEGARILAVHGLRHRSAVVELGHVVTQLGVVEDRSTLFGGVRQILLREPEEWRSRLGALVFERTLQDVS